VLDTGSPITVPVGDITRPRVQRHAATASTSRRETLDVKDGQIHWQPPAFADLERSRDAGDRHQSADPPRIKGGKIGLFGGAGVGKTVLIQR
jgi:F-type H+-transporting ATPase subunit beta